MGHDLHARCLAAHTDGVTDLRPRVYDGDETAMAAALHWGYEPVQLSITSRVELEGDTQPEAPAGVTLEAIDDLTVNDQGAFDELVAVSQTNPEAVNSQRMSREEMQHWVFPGERAVGTRGRRGLHGVDPQFRGRGLGRLVRQHVHHRAARLGIRELVTDNEQHNHGIRRLNAELGHVPVYGVRRMRRTR